MRALLFVAAFLFASAAAAQLRTIPPGAKLASARHVSENIVELNGSEHHLSPGAQIRDAMNRIIVPAALPAGARVKYQLDAAGLVHRVWILTPQEREETH